MVKGILTAEDARRAVDEASKANALAMMLTPVTRLAIAGPTPMAVIDAPEAGTGKGLLCQVASLVATGREKPFMSAPEDDGEWPKVLTASLLSGTPVIVIDNVVRPLASPHLASVLTTGEWTGRLLGLSKMVALPVQVSWVANGNNVELKGDLPRRSYWVRLDAKTTRPWERTGFKHPELLTWISNHRAEINRALLILARAWYAAGKPEFEFSVVGGFSAWTRIIGGVLGFAGVKGFLGNLTLMYDRSDENAGQWGNFLEALSSVFDGNEFTVKQVIEQIDNSRIREALPDDVFFDPDKAASYSRRLGHAFARREGRRHGETGIHLERNGSVRHAVVWKVVMGEFRYRRRVYSTHSKGRT